jgi:CO/xanthine dehydrogenase Mo-binding subunit
MLHAKVLRSRYPHALIKRIDASRAEKHPDVAVVLTHKDVPGLNAYGIVIPDQPVLCREKVRYLGDAVALVAAETKEAAEEALDLIEVDYEPLPVVTDPSSAMRDDAPQIHDAGNIHRHAHVTRGDAAKRFRESFLVVENTYQTGRQMHMFLETESGVAFIDDQDRIVVCAGGQAPYRDRLQISRALGIAQDRIRIISTPVGGAFGGKDEITVQIHLALVALRTRRPVKLVWTREESGIAGWKRHPMTITMKTGVSSDGILLANQVRIVADTGAYASLGGTIMDVTMENSCGPYRVANVDIEGYCVYTNNGVAGAMRGFGAPQANFAMECQMDILAEKLGIDKIQFRKMNAVKRGDIGPFGNPITGSVGIQQALEEAERGYLWSNRRTLIRQSSLPWKKFGVGLAAAVKGSGFGALPDFAGASITITREGRFIVGVSCPEIGQGNTTAYTQIAAEALRCDPRDIDVVSADTALAPDSGTSTASRSVYAGGNAILAAAEKMSKGLLSAASETLEEPVENLFRETGFVLSDRSKRRVSFLEIAEHIYSSGLESSVIAGFTWPRVERPYPGSIEIPHITHMYGAATVLVEVDTLTGVVRPLQVELYQDAGRIVNPQGFQGQCEGGAVQGIGYALTEEVLMEDGYIKTPNFTTYIIPTIFDVPEIVVKSVGACEESGPFGAKGAAELPLIPIAPAIVNAINDAVGIRILRIPATPERVYRALLQAGKSYIPGK